ncbi:hypothetical protein J6TS2_40290 [Heyndrickxia sporothermodurans]|nr:hypothetical protein J6TS2_40290 [Heyndrickxia sporothermodurans]
MKVIDLLNHEQKRKLIERREKPPSNKEELSHQEILELMGTNRDIYQRYHGVWRRK